MKKCFVIMGFGKKTDYSTGKTLDLNSTYKNIIQPAVKKSGYECIRADEIQDSGLIDKSMYVLLMSAELVIADISTYNPNAIYELGIRHAVKPYSTIIIKERDGNIPFDLDHTRTFKYTHLGDDIGADESQRCQEDLVNLIESISHTHAIDSPLYQYVKVTPPKVSDDEINRIIKELADKENHIFAIVEQAQNSMKSSDFIEASSYWEKALTSIPNDPYFIQQHALCRYKSKSPSKLIALTDALSIIETINVDDTSHDPETLGITGAIYKNLYLLTDDPQSLQRAIYYYGKGFDLRNDYYTGENYALCLDLNLKHENDNDERTYLKLEAKKTREKIIKRLETFISDEIINEMPDKKWIYATLSICYTFTKDYGKGSSYKTCFLNESPVQWEIDTFDNSYNMLSEIHNIK